MSPIEIGGCRYYDLTIETGKLYEVWLRHDDKQEVCVAVKMLMHGFWEVLIGSKLKLIASNKIFEIGKSTRPPPGPAMPTIFNLDFTYGKTEDKP